MRILGSFLIAALLLPAVLAAELTEQERRGRKIYLRGTSGTGADIVALIGVARTEVPASVLPCGGCHGPEGRGRPQDGLGAADLTWPTLSRPLAAGGANGRRRPPYTEPLLKRAVTRGLDAAGNPLHVAMPRYRLTVKDADDLVAYVRRLGVAAAPGHGTD